MATLKELLAAKQATSKDQPAKAGTTNVVDDQELTEAIDRIDPPKKPRPTSLVLSKSAEPDLPPQEPIKESWQEGRALGATKGELIPMAPAITTKEQDHWYHSLSALETQLCVIQCPDSPESCWLALMPDKRMVKPLPLLLHRLPWLLYPAKPTNGQPF